MDCFADLSKLFSNVFTRQLKILQKGLGHEEKGLFVPSTEPVQRATVDQGWELPASQSEVITDRRHAQTDME